MGTRICFVINVKWNFSNFHFLDFFFFNFLFSASKLKILMYNSTSISQPTSDLKDASMKEVLEKSRG